MKDSSIEELMVAYKIGSHEAFQHLYQKLSPVLYGYLKKRLRNNTEADDVLQIVFTKIHTSRHQYNNSFPLLPWVFTICRTSLADYTTAKIKVHKIEESLQKEYGDFRPGEKSPEGNILPEGARELLQQFKKFLTGNQILALEMRYVGDKTFKEIATRLKTSESNVRKIVSRALKKIKDQLKT